MNTQPESTPIASLQPGMTFLGFALVRSAEVRTSNAGKQYLDINLMDKSGEINGKLWNLQSTMPTPVSGSVVKVRGSVELFNGRLQFRVEQIRAARDDDEYDIDALVPCAPEKPEAMQKMIDDTIDRFASENLKKIVREMLRLAGDPLVYFPAAQRMHHAERSGLLHHTTSMLRTAEHIIEAYPFLNGDLLRAGVIIHDLAKIDEMLSDNFGSVKDYSRDGLLIGHLVRGVATLDQAARNVGVSGEMVELLEHMIISHHGIPEYGSPRLPMFMEAEVLHWIDTLDARLNEMQAIQARTPEGVFSERIASLDGRRMFHPFYTDTAE